MCLRTVEEQQEYDPNPIDPNTIEIPSYIPLLINFNYDVNLVGALVRLHEGRLWCDAKIPDDWPIGVLVIQFSTDGEKVVLNAVSITDNPVDKGNSPFEILH